MRDGEVRLGLSNGTACQCPNAKLLKGNRSINAGEENPMSTETSCRSKGQSEWSRAVQPVTQCLQIQMHDLVLAAQCYVGRNEGELHWIGLLTE